MIRARNWAALLLPLVACAPLREGPTPVEPVTGPSAPALATPPGRYVVRPGDGRVEIRVYRAGPLAALGHNHVIESREFTGTIVVADDALDSSAAFEFPVDSLVVDPPAARAAAGAAFASVPTEADKAGTAANMRGPRVLDAATYPRIRARFEAETVDRDVTRGRLGVEVAGRSASVPVQGHVTRTEEGLVVRVAFTLRHADLGLAPFSALGGALSVAQAMEVTVALTARLDVDQDDDNDDARRPIDNVGGYRQIGQTELVRPDE